MTGAPHRLEEETVSASQTFTMLKDLQPGTSYVVRVLAENDVGRGNPSESQQFLTKEAGKVNNLLHIRMVIYMHILDVHNTSH